MKTIRLKLTILLLVSLVVYFNALFNEFVYDDKHQILENDWITDVRRLPEIFSSSVWSYQNIPIVSNYYRPMMHAANMLMYYVFGLNPWGFHLVNVLIHAGNSVLVFLIIAGLLRQSQPMNTPLPKRGKGEASQDIGESAALWAALLFAAHPIHTEAVTWVAGIPDLAFTFLYLLSFYLYLRDTGFTRGYVASVLLFFLATLFKEPALTLPAILIGYDFAFRRAEFRLAGALKRYAPYLGVSGLYLVLRYNALGGLAPEIKHADLSAFQCIINIFPLFSQYLQKLLIPVNLNAFYVLHPSSSILELKGLISLLIFAIVFTATLLALKKNRLVFLGLLFIIVPLLPVLYIRGLGVNAFAERYLYLPSFGFVLLAALFLAWVKNNKPRIYSGLSVVVVALIGFYSLGTINRNTIWKDDFTLFSDTVKKSPDSALMRYNLGMVYQEKNLRDEAIEHYEAGLKLNPYYADLRYNLALVYGTKGMVAQAIEQCQWASQLDPEKNQSFCDYYIGLLHNLEKQNDKTGRNR